MEEASWLLLASRLGVNELFLGFFDSLWAPEGEPPSVDVFDYHAEGNALIEVGLVARAAGVVGDPDPMGLVRSGLLQNRLDGKDEPLAFIREKLLVTGWKLAHFNRINLRTRDGEGAVSNHRRNRLDLKVTVSLFDHCAGAAVRMTIDWSACVGNRPFTVRLTGQVLREGR